MNDRIPEATIRVVLGVGEVESLVRPPPPHSCSWPRLPAEGPGGDGLAQTIDRHGAMGRGAAEEVSPAQVRRVAIGAGVHEAGGAEDGALDAQKIGVPVPATADRPEIGRASCRERGEIWWVSG